MSKQGVIKTSTWSNTWTGPKGNVEYHKVTFEGDDKTYQIGSKDKNPSFLSVGSTLYYEEKDAKGGIKRVEAPQTNGSGLGGSASFSKSVDNTVDVAISNATLFVVHGIVKPDQLEATAKRFIELSKKLKAE